MSVDRFHVGQDGYKCYTDEGPHVSFNDYEELETVRDERIAELEAAMRSISRSKNLTEACSHACIAMGH